MQVSALAPILLEKPPRRSTSLAGSGRAELATRLAELGVPAREERMRVAQLWHWIYHRGADRLWSDDNGRQGDARQARAKLQP